MVDRVEEAASEDFRVLPQGANRSRPITLAESVLQRSVVLKRPSEAKAPDLAHAWLASVCAALGFFAAALWLIARQPYRAGEASQGKSRMWPIQAAAGSPGSGIEATMLGSPRSRG